MCCLSHTFWPVLTRQRLRFTFDGIGGSVQEVHLIHFRYLHRFETCINPRHANGYLVCISSQSDHSIKAQLVWITKKEEENRAVEPFGRLFIEGDFLLQLLS